MKRLTHLLLALSLIILSLNTYAQTGFTLQNQNLDNPDNEPAPVHPVPYEQQIQWQELEFYAFFHYGMNTYTGKEWGFGDEAETIFAPTEAPDPAQWLKVAKAAGMRGGIAVVKHHDGFCLWPTATTTHNVTRSGNIHGQNTNIPRDFARAARKLDMKYGFYISPWDRNSPLYGTPEYVSQVFLRQCAELAAYGTDQFEMWFDGANGGDGYYGGANETRSIDRETYYDIPNLRDSVHKVCPQCILWGMGGEARWIGNEAGWAGETNWSTENRGFAPERNGMYGTEDGWFWLPGESDAKITNKGWFYHEGESALPVERLFQMYLETVGRNATLLLNIPPDKTGKIPEYTADTLKQLGKLLKERFRHDLALKAGITATGTRASGANRDYLPSNLNDGDKDTYWATDDEQTSAVITLVWDKPQTVRYVALMEYIRKGQRIRKFHIEYSPNGSTWLPAAPGVKCTTVGYKRIIPLNGSTAQSYGEGYSAKAIRITIDDSKACPLIHTISVY